ncbi:MAG TPA: MFS transporter [Gaiellaceae bacterium]
MRARLLDSFAALRERPFRLLFTAQAISTFGDMLVPVALAFAVLDLTGSATDLGFVLTARLLPMVVFMLAGGVWADRLPREALMIGSSLVRLVTQAALGLLLVTGTARIWELVALQVVHGAATAFFRPASTGIVPQTVSPARLQQANALMWGAVGTAGFAGPAVAGVLLAVASPGWALFLDALTFAISAWLLSRLRLPPREPSPRDTFVADLAAGWREVVSRRWLWASIVVFSVFQLTVLASLSVLGPLVAKRSLGGSSAWALIAAGFGVGSILGNFAALHFRPRRPLLASYSLCAASAPSLFFLAFAIPAPIIACSEVFAGLSIGLAGVLYETTLQQQIPQEAYGRVASWDWMGSTALRPLGLAVMGPLAALVGVRPVLIGSGSLVLASLVALLAVPEVRAMRSLGAAPEHVEPVVVGPEPMAEDQALGL